MGYVTLPETNSSPLQMDGWNTTFLLGFGLFSGAKMLVSGRVVPRQVRPYFKGGGWGVAFTLKFSSHDIHGQATRWFTYRQLESTYTVGDPKSIRWIMDETEKCMHICIRSHFGSSPKARVWMRH